MTKEEELVSLLTEANATVATAESCTGGSIAARITDVPGASAVFGYGLCTYANEAKTRLLGVSEDILAAHGAVSDETARAMAQGLYALTGADLCLCVTGIAGPGGGTAEKPVGLVYFGFCRRGETFTACRRFCDTAPLSRREVREAAVDFALAEAVRLWRERHD